MADETLKEKATELLYFVDTFQFECEAQVLSVDEHVVPDAETPSSNKIYAIVLDKTVAYPAGGGQPSDVGRLICNSSSVVFDVTQVVAGKDGIVKHIGTFPEEGVEPFKKDSEVTVKIDQDTRMLHARIHSAGHLLDFAMGNVGYPSNILRPAKGLHSVEQAYVEYDGKVEGLDKDDLIAKLTQEMNKLVTKGGVTQSTLMAYDDAKIICGGHLPSYIEKDSSPRIVVILDSTEGCPCGGTHVTDVSDIGPVEVTGIRVKKKVTRVSYTIQGMKEE